MKEVSFQKKENYPHFWFFQFFIFSFMSFSLINTSKLLAKKDYYINLFFVSSFNLT